MADTVGTTREPEGDRLWPVLAACGGAVLAAAIGSVMVGDGDPVIARIATLLGVWIHAGWSPALYLLGAIGWGTLFARRVNHASIAGALGLACTLGVSLVLGTLGLLGPISAWAWTGAGLLLLAHGAKRGHRRWLASVEDIRRDRVASGAVLLGCAAIGVMLTGAALPPGTLWDSEFGGYDALSYHLQLPAEWLENGRIESVTHNVYSYLPSAFEAGVVHLAHLAVLPGVTREGLNGFLVGSGDHAMSASFLALGLAAYAAWCVGGFASELANRFGADTEGRTRSACFAGALVLLTPWTQVVGTLAYNETGAVALGAAALSAAMLGGLSPVRRGLLVAVLMGAACGCKPTAVLLLGPACAVLMAWSAPPRSWVAMFGVGAVVGLLTLSPWMMRNTMAGGNPVFPHAAGLFGSAHWSAEQIATYRAGHTFDGTALDRALMLVRPDPSVGLDAPTIARFRGLTNPQWALTPWLGLLGISGLLAVRRSHRCGAALGASLLGGVVLWMLATHLQSRFLVMLLPLFAGSFGAGVALVAHRAVRHAALVALLASGVWSFSNFATQQDGHPNGMLVLGTTFASGRVDLGETSDESVWSWINRNIPTGELLIVGDAAPYYYRRPVRYATVWDTHPLAQVMRDHPDDPEAWAGLLRADGVGWVLISWNELDRLSRSGWSDPLLSPDRVKGWTDRLAPPARVWRSGYSLHRIGDR